MEWISVDDRVPENGYHEVLAVTVREILIISCLNGEWGFDEEWKTQYPVLYWMPLPTAPK